MNGTVSENLKLCGQEFYELPIKNVKKWERVRRKVKSWPKGDVVEG